MKKMWWKILCVILMVYAIIGGMLFPLSPSVQQVDAKPASTGQSMTFNVFGYNTFYSKSPSVKAWLRKDSTLDICASNVKVVTDRQLEVTFDIPERISETPKAVNLTLVVDGSYDGNSVLPSAIAVTQLPTQAPMAASCTIEKLSAGQQGITFPFRNILEETIRNLYYHVPLWFAMIILFFTSMVFSIMYLRSKKLRHSVLAAEFARVGVLFGFLGLTTGMIWAKHTWGAYWNWDLRQNTAAVQVLIYVAYFILRDSFDDLEKKSRISSVYNIFAFATVIPLMFVIPRMLPSLHPGSGGNPALGANDLDNTMRMVFYPAIIGFTLLGVWITSLFTRLELVRLRYLDDDK